MANYKVTDSDLISIATAIRARAGISKQLIFPTEFVSEIENIPSGGGETGSILYGYTEPDSSLGNDGEIYLRLSDSSSIYELPDAYTCLEYLEAYGNQSIDTGVDLTDTSFFELEASFTRDTSNNNVYGLGYSNKETNVLANSSKIHVQVACGKVSIPFDQYKHTFSWKNNSIKIDTVVGTPRSSLPLGNRIRLFATAYGGSFNSSRISYAKIYHCKIYNSDTVIREFIPVKRNSDNVLGMYDLANDIFYTNSGTGDFIGGPECSNEDEIIEILVKVNGAWQELLHTNIDDVDVSGGGGDTYAL